MMERWSISFLCGGSAVTPGGMRSSDPWQPPIKQLSEVQSISSGSSPAWSTSEENTSRIIWREEKKTFIRIRELTVKTHQSSPLSASAGKGSIAGDHIGGWDWGCVRGRGRLGLPPPWLTEQHTKCLPEVLQMEESKTEDPLQGVLEAALIFHQNCVYTRKQTRKEVCCLNPPPAVSLSLTRFILLIFSDSPKSPNLSSTLLLF